ncbi:MAG: hypothetical protein ACP5QB_10095 [Thiomonas sp.]
MTFDDLEQVEEPSLEEPQAPEAEPPKAEEPKPEPPAQPQEDPRENLMREIAARYSLPAEMRQQFVAEPDKVLPQLVARVYLDVFDAVMNVITQQMPGMLAQFQEWRRAEEEFFNRWPELRDPKYHKAIREVAQALKAAEPNITPEQARERIGATVMAMYGLQPRPRPVRPPVPASPGGVAPRATQTDKTIWDELSEV